jgi:hypothetical protein
MNGNKLVQREGKPRKILEKFHSQFMWSKCFVDDRSNFFRESSRRQSNKIPRAAAELTAVFFRGNLR